MSTLRIVGGRLGGRRFAGPVRDATRPTADRVREAIASALDARGALVDAHVLDVFAGTGALAFEALSRGAARALLVDSAPACVRAIGESARQLGLDAQVRVLRMDLLKRSARVASKLADALETPVNLVFADAPYAAAAGVPPLLADLAATGKLAIEAWIVLEYDPRTCLQPPEGFTSLGAYRYGDTGVLLWRWQGD